MIALLVQIWPVAAATLLVLVVFFAFLMLMDWD